MTIEEVLKSSKPIEDKHHRTYLNIIYSGIWLDLQTVEPLRIQGLTHPQYNVLRIVNGYKKPIPVASIQQRMLFQTSNVTRIVDKLLEKGLLEKETSLADRRVVLVTLTPLGKQKVDDLHNQVYSNVREVIGKNLSENETVLLGELLDKMRT